MRSLYVITTRYRVLMSALTPLEIPRFLRPSIETRATGRYQYDPKTGRKQRLLHTKFYIGFYEFPWPTQRTRYLPTLC
jgi:hypothetical protein